MDAVKSGEKQYEIRRNEIRRMTIVDIIKKPDNALSTSYSDFKSELDAELSKSAEGFVRIGYLLKIARDTDVLKGRYNSVNEFAMAEYGIDKTTVSRWMRINDKFSEGGYSDQLQDQYKGFGYTKLAIMLQLPDSINETITPEYSRADIQQIKDDVDEEKQISDVEAMIDQIEHPQTDDRLRLFLKEIDMPEACLYDGFAATEALAPQGDGYISARVPGIGKLGMTIRDGCDTVTLTNIRTGEHWEYSTSEVNNTYSEWIERYKRINTDWEKRRRNGEPAYTEKPSKTVSRVTKSKKEDVAPAQPKEPRREVITTSDRNISLEIVPGIKCEIEDVDKTADEARKEELKAIIESAPSHTEEDIQAAVQEDITTTVYEEHPDKHKLVASITLKLGKLQSLWQGDRDIDMMILTADRLIQDLKALKEEAHES